MRENNQGERYLQTDVQTRKSAAMVRILLEGIVDYAGLFPPATLPLDVAVRNYSAYRSSANAWMLGRFVVSASRLPELAAMLPEAETNNSPCRISALVGKDFDAELENVGKFNEHASQYGHVDSIEMAPELHTKIEAVSAGIPRGITAYFELPLNAPLELLKTIGRNGARAKARTGGTRPEAIPPTSDLAAFIANCVSAGIAYKATAGLHHPIRSTRPLTYEPGSVAGEMHGFLNVLVASAFVMAGFPLATINELLADTESSSFLFTDSEVQWKEKSVLTSQLRKTREQLFVSFGSCSFEEPVEDLISLGWL
ncbi:MAG TPA: hypothetical protein VN684_02985 [Terriglobales bacterium]|nr:hypothetical protein [Terriglobales bacterium]